VERDSRQKTVRSSRALPVEFYDRDRSQVRTEPIYGENWLRWAYENPLGRLSTRVLVSRAAFSRFYGRRMSTPASRERVAPFIENFDLDPSEFEKPPEAFTSFNDFFSRRLKPEARPVDPDPKRVVFPADGRHLVIPDIGNTTGLYVKGQRLQLADLLQDQFDPAPYRRGGALLSRLCPLDYHRFHFPLEGTPKAAAWLDGPLYSVNPIALRRNIDYLIKNKKTVVALDTPGAGPVLVIPVGATNVGCIQLTFTPGQAIAKGDEMGYFEFGGSSVITLFPEGSLHFDEDILQQSHHHRETYAQMGTSLATLS
jgi:phosphatidylserine decarboxylase